MQWAWVPFSEMLMWSYYASNTNTAQKTVMCFVQLLNYAQSGKLLRHFRQTDVLDLWYHCTGKTWIHTKCGCPVVLQILARNCSHPHIFQTLIFPKSQSYNPTLVHMRRQFWTFTALSLPLTQALFFRSKASLQLAASTKAIWEEHLHKTMSAKFDSWHLLSPLQGRITSDIIWYRKNRVHNTLKEDREQTQKLIGDDRGIMMKVSSPSCSF